jgi:ribonuclease T2
MEPMFRRMLALALGILLAAGASAARRKRAASFDYYLMVLSWAPDFCASPGTSHDPAECAPGKRIGFVVHGLWQQAAAGRGPVCTADGQKVPARIVDLMLTYMASKGLIQHEWNAHGSCSGLNLDDYFAAIRKARDAVAIPSAFRSPNGESTMTAAQIEAAFASANPSFPAQAFRATCSGGALRDVRVCFSKDLSPRACTASAGECPGPMKILPVR